ncbi:IclR family transcriptional regulator [Nocardia sp. NPDC004711]
MASGKHHRTVDRVVLALEMIARSPDGLTLKAVAEAQGAPKSSVQQLLSGLVATGYLDSDGTRYTLGPGPQLLSLMAGAPLPALRVPHEKLVALGGALNRSVYVGVRFGDSCISLDQVGLTHMWDFASWDRSRRPLLITAAGKVILAGLPDADLHSFLSSARKSEPHHVETFLAELPEIRATALAYNYGATYREVIAVATPLYDRQGAFVAAVCATDSKENLDGLTALGHRLKDGVAGWVLK